MASSEHVNNFGDNFGLLAGDGLYAHEHAYHADDGLVIPGVDPEASVAPTSFDPEYAELARLTDCFDTEARIEELMSTPPPRLVNREQLPYDRQRDDIVSVVLKTVPEALAAAKTIRAEADSYRAKVGAALIASKTSRKGTRLYMYTAANYKADPTVEKNCAELAVLEQAAKDKCTRAELFVVAGPSGEKTIQSIAEVPAKTLHPCKQCRGMCACSPLVQADTQFLTYSAARGGIYQLQSFEEMTARYERFEATGQYHDPRTFRFKPVDWVLHGDKYARDVEASGLLPLDSVLDEPRLLVRRELALHIGRPLLRSL